MHLIQSFFDKKGVAFAFLDEDHKSIFLWDGSPAGHVFENAVYSYEGKPIGWLLDGWLLNQQGEYIGFLKTAGENGPVKPIVLTDFTPPQIKNRPEKTSHNHNFEKFKHPKSWADVNAVEFFAPHLHAVKQPVR